MNLANYRAVLVGAGSMGKGWGKNLQDHGEVDVVGWVDIRPEAAAAASEERQFTNCWTGDDLEKCLAETNPDFVVDTLGVALAIGAPLGLDVGVALGVALAIGAPLGLDVGVALGDRKSVV